MSDEYGSQNGYKNSLVDETVADTVPNYPTGTDSTSSGGSGSHRDAWSTKAQRGRHDPENPSPFVSGRQSPVSNPNSGYATPNRDNTLLDQSTSGGDLKGALGRQYVGDSWETKEEAAQHLAERSQSNH